MNKVESWAVDREEGGGKGRRGGWKKTRGLREGRNRGSQEGEALIVGDKADIGIGLAQGKC